MVQIKTLTLLSSVPRLSLVLGYNSINLVFEQIRLATVPEHTVVHFVWSLLASAFSHPRRLPETSE